MSIKLEDMQIPLTEIMAKIKKKILDEVELEVITTTVFLPCINRRIFIMERESGSGKKSRPKNLIASIMIDKNCDMPLTIKRQQIWIETLEYLIKACKHQTCDDFFRNSVEHLAQRTLIDGQLEIQALKFFLPKIMSRSWRRSRHISTIIDQIREVPELPELQLRPNVIKRIETKIEKHAGDLRTIVTNILQEIEEA